VAEAAGADSNASTGEPSGGVALYHDRLY